MQKNQTMILSAYDLSHNLPNLVKLITKQKRTESISTIYNQVAIIFGYESHLDLVNHHKKNETFLSLNDTIDKTRIYAEISALIPKKKALCLKLLSQFDCFKIQNNTIGKDIILLTDNLFCYQAGDEFYLSTYQFEQYSKTDLAILVSEIEYEMLIKFRKHIPFSLNIFRVPTAIHINFDNLKEKDYSKLSLSDKVMMLYSYDLNNISKKQAYAFYLVFSTKDIDVINLMNQLVQKRYQHQLNPLPLDKAINMFNLCYTKKCDYSHSQILLEKQTQCYPYFNTAQFDQDFVHADSMLFTHLNITYNKEISCQFGIESCIMPDYNTNILERHKSHMADIICNANTNPLTKIQDELSTGIISLFHSKQILHNQRLLLNLYSKYISIGLDAPPITPIMHSEKYTHYLHTNGFPVHSDYLCGKVAENNSQQDITMLLYRSGSGLVAHFHYDILNRINQGKKVILIDPWQMFERMSAIFKGERVYTRTTENAPNRKIMNIDLFQYINGEYSLYSEKEIKTLSLFLKEILINYSENELIVNDTLKRTKFNHIFHFLETHPELSLKENSKQWLSGPCLDMSNAFICFNLDVDYLNDYGDAITITNVIAILAGHFSDRHFALLNDYDYDLKIDYTLHTSSSITYAVHWEMFKHFPATNLSKVNRLIPLRGKIGATAYSNYSVAIDVDAIRRNKSHFFSSLFTEYYKELEKVYSTPFHKDKSFVRLVILNKIDNEWKLTFMHEKKDRLIKVLQCSTDFSIIETIANELHSELNKINTSLSLHSTDAILTMLNKF